MNNMKVKAKIGEHPRGDVGQAIALVLFLVIWVSDSFFLKVTTGFSIYVPLALRLAILVCTLALSALLLKTGHVVVEHDGAPRGVMSSGAFRHVRHPLYLGSVLPYIGLSVSTCSLASLCFSALIFVFYDRIASYEERYLEREFGDAYRSYKMRTGKWLPRIRTNA
jgi:protein-S-isoprenylcysteine O-methyltransferase Ste14